MTEFLQHVVNGVSLGTIYALIALGYTMVYGVLKLINFAHGDVYMAAAAGVLVALQTPKIEPYMGILPGLKAFVAAVLGGIGNIPGAVVGGLIMGVAEVMVTGYLSPTYRDAIAFVLLIVILLVRPAGIFGKSVTEKV